MEAVADGVRVWGARGRPATPTYKISATYMDGYKVGTGTVPVWHLPKILHTLDGCVYTST